ncbi:hypothetical protein TNIN_267901 [Trichonephila inaurata madagascariensis]|uniref:Uncharacterized protein n=1 Tax=Trichonephila inaurata madagascariensis TaxID=2747483 RepID=A0A8X7BTS1_9ARAC|nr:hypothetical protein TNIN_267901 [Trichonephila inaurata madagascariensis]
MASLCLEAEQTGRRLVLIRICFSSLNVVPTAVEPTEEQGVGCWWRQKRHRLWKTVAVFVNSRSSLQRKNTQRIFICQ